MTQTIYKTYLSYLSCAIKLDNGDWEDKLDLFLTKR